MTTTLTITSGQTSFTAQGYTILPSPGTAVPDNLAQAILSAANTAGVVLSSSAGTGNVFVPSRRFTSTTTGAPSTGQWFLGDEIIDSVGNIYECTAGGSPGTWVAAQVNGVFVPLGDLTSFGIHTPEKYGAAKATLGATGSITSGAAILTDSSASFTGADVGKTICVGVTGYNSVLVTTILSRQSATQVTLAANAPSTVTNQPYVFGTDATSALNAMFTAAPTGSSFYLSGLYLTSGAVNVNKQGRIGGGGGFGFSLTVGITGTGIVSTSATASGLVENATGIVMEHFGIWNAAVTTPSAGAGISTTSGMFGKKYGLFISGFYDLTNHGATSGYYWSMEHCHLYDSVRYGSYIGNTTPNSDAGDMFVKSNYYSSWSTTRTPVAAMRWESGGGLRFDGNKVNAGPSSPGYQYAVDIQVADGVSTGDLFFDNNSLENVNTAILRVGPLGTTGYVSKIIWSNNESLGKGSSVAAALLSGPTGTQTQIKEVIFGTGNQWANTPGGIVAKYLTSIFVATQDWGDVGRGPVISLGIAGDINAGPNAAVVDQQVLGFDSSTGAPVANVTVVADYRSRSSKTALNGVIDRRYRRGFYCDVSGTWVTLFTWTVDYSGTQNAGGGRAVFELDAYDQEHNLPIGMKMERSYTASGAGATPTLATIGTDTTWGGGTAYAVQWLASANTVTVQVKYTGTGSVLKGVAEIDVKGDTTTFGIG